MGLARLWLLCKHIVQMCAQRVLRLVQFAFDSSNKSSTFLLNLQLRRLRGLTCQEEGVMRISGRMLLRLKQRIKIPEAATAATTIMQARAGAMSTQK